MPGSPSTADGTGAVLQALSPNSKSADRGLSYLRQAQRPGGGFPLGGNGAVNTQSTAWAIQGILAAGGDPGAFRRGGKSAPEYLAAQQAERRPLPLLEVKQPDADLGHRPGPRRGRRRLLPVPPPPASPRHPQAAPSPASPIPGLTPGTSPGGGIVPPVTGDSRRSEAPPPSPTTPGSGGRVLSRTFCARREPGPRGVQPNRSPPRGEGGRGPPTGEAEAPRPRAVQRRLDRSSAGADRPRSARRRLLFAAGLGIRKLWMRQRYGL